MIALGRCLINKRFDSNFTDKPSLPWIAILKLTQLSYLTSVTNTRNLMLETAYTKSNRPL